MQVILGQDKLINQFKELSIKTLPKALLLIGPKGSGKHLLAEFIAEQVGLPLTVLTEKTTAEELSMYAMAPGSALFLMDFSNIALKQQNQFLKFIEEPNVSAFNIVLAESETSILPTALNRCVKYFLAPYSKETLKQLYPEFTDDLVFEICKTPGQLKDVSQKQLASLFKMCTSLVQHIQEVDYGQLLRLELLINYKEEYDYFDFDQFLSTLTLAAFNAFTTSKNDLYFKVYQFCAAEQSNLVGKAYDKERFMVGFLDRLWRLVH